MYKNQLQELAQRSCFNLPAYACFREGPDHAPRFRASVNFNGDIFESPNYCPTLRQAEHAAAEVALNVLSTTGPCSSLTARVLDETGIYKNLLQETAHRAGLKLPRYTTVRSGPGHVPTFTCAVELAGMNFTGEPAKTKKQAEKNAAIAAWSALKTIASSETCMFAQMPDLGSLTNKEAYNTREEQDQAVVTRVLSSLRPRDDANNNSSKQLFIRRDQNQIQSQRRMVRGQASTPSSSNSSTNSLQNQHRRLMDLLTDFVPEVSTMRKPNSFASLLPPPPLRTSSKILPPSALLNKDNSSSSSTLSSSSFRHIPVQVRGRSQVIAPPLEEHRRDEEEWLGIKKAIEKEGPGNSSSSSSSAIFASSSAYRHFPMSNTVRLSTYGPMKAVPTSRSNMIPTDRRSMYTGGLNPHSIAPAVQIRSVIPVCSAPPPTAVRPPPQSNPPPPTTIVSQSTSSSGSTDSHESNSTQLGSEFNKLQLR